jgi:hypothetical protein
VHHHDAEAGFFPFQKKKLVGRCFVSSGGKVVGPNVRKTKPTFICFISTNKDKGGLKCKKMVKHATS